MLKAKSLPKVLSKVQTDGVDCVLLFEGNGSLLGSTGDELFANKVKNQVLAAITANVWGEFSKGRHDGLQSMVINCTDGKCVLVKILNDFILLVGGTDVHDGMLMIKAKEMKDILEELLENFQAV